MRFRSILFVLIAVLSSPVYSQNINPGGEEIYIESEVAVIRLTMSSEDKEFLLSEDNLESDVYLPAVFSFANSLIDTTLNFNVGIRLRGNTSRYHPKKSFKLKFKEFEGEKFYDLKKFNLKAENNDASLTRELLTLRAFRNMDVAAARTHHAEVYINDEYMGIYLNVEQIDDEFVQARFDYNEGNIYKCSWGATLEDDGQIYDNGKYELETNTDLNDRSVLANFVDVLNNTSSSSFIEEIEEVFDVDRYVRYLAVEALTGHWDGYSYNQNNYYLYENNETGLVEFIPYDVDNTFGMDWVNRDWGTRDVLDWPKHGEPRPLTKKILAQPKYQWLYKNYLNDMLEGEFSENYYFPVFDSFKSLLADPVSRDTYYPQTFGFTINDFNNSFTEQVADHAPYGLKPYVTTRSNFAIDQIGIVTALTEKLESNINLYPNPSSGKTLTLETEALIKDLRIVDTQGRAKFFTIHNAGESQYRLEMNLSSGMYIVILGEFSQKLLIK